VSDQAELFIDCRCELGEGPFWHPLRKQLFWFDIPNQTLYSADKSGAMLDRWIFDDRAAAAAVINENELAVAVAGSLVRLNLDTNERSQIVPIEAEKPGNRTNDSRVNPAGGFWIGTMSRKGDDEPEVGSVYQYRNGAITTLFDQITIPNSICFSPDGKTAYFTDTPTRRILKRAIDPSTGLPSGDWETFSDLEATGQVGFPDGSIVDAEGYLWNARWGGHSVVRHRPDGTVDRIIEVPTGRITCPALGGDDLKTLYITSAREGMTPEEIEAEPLAGSIFSIRVDTPGLPDPLLKL
jgi:sugar lactone lactonase YvrE